MQCRTHIAFGIAVNLAIAHTGDIKTLLVTIAGAAVGSSISDLDSSNSESSQILNKITFVIVAIVALFFIINYLFGLKIIDKIVEHGNLTNILIGTLLFLFVSILGSYTKHRTFMHSFTCVAIYYVVLSSFLSQTFVIPFSIGMISHIVLDLLNHIGVGIFCPLTEKRFCIDICDSNGVVNSLLFYISVVVAAYFCVCTF